MRRRQNRGGVWRDLRRRQPFREVKKRILVFSEGKKTEPGYIQAFARARRDRVMVVVENGHGVPKTLVEKAAERKRAEDEAAKRRGSIDPDFDEVWCVFDVDEHPMVPEAKQQAKDNGVCLAISNPCFELWALLHFQDQTAHIERDSAKRLLRKHLPDYEKELSFGKLEQRYTDAVRRAVALDKRHARAYMDGSNPSTGVYRLTMSIDGANGNSP